VRRDTAGDLGWLGVPPSADETFEESLKAKGSWLPATETFCWIEFEEIVDSWLRGQQGDQDWLGTARLEEAAQED
jgi:hypothetical protein